jgi:hypothetical protein
MAKEIKICLENGEELIYHDIIHVEETREGVTFYREEGSIIRPVAFFKKREVRSWFEVPSESE